MIRDVHPGSVSLFFLPIPDPGVKKAPGPGSGSRNTASMTGVVLYTVGNFFSCNPAVLTPVKHLPFTESQFIA
jgi:hypothetical protein